MTNAARHLADLVLAVVLFTFGYAVNDLQDGVVEVHQHWWSSAAVLLVLAAAALRVTDRSRRASDRASPQRHRADRPEPKRYRTVSDRDCPRPIRAGGWSFSESQHRATSSSLPNADRGSRSRSPTAGASQCPQALPSPNPYRGDSARRPHRRGRDRGGDPPHRQALRRRARIEPADDFVDTVKWRTGCEGRVSHLKRDWARRRTRLRGHPGARTGAPTASSPHATPP